MKNIDKVCSEDACKSLGRFSSTQVISKSLVFFFVGPNQHGCIESFENIGRIVCIAIDYFIDLN